MGIDREGWERVQRELSAARREAEAAIHEALASLIRSNWGDTITKLKEAQKAVQRLEDERGGIY